MNERLKTILVVNDEPLKLKMLRKTAFLFLYLFFSFTGFAQEPGEDLLNLSTITPSDYDARDLAVRHLSTGLELSVNTGVKGSISFYPEDEYWDLTQWVFLSMELENLTEKEVRFDPVLSYDNPGRGDNYKMVYNTHIGFLHPSESLVYNCLMIRDQITAPDYPQKIDFPGMKGMPDGIILNFAGFDAKRIKELEIIIPEQDFDQTVLLKRVFKNRQALPDLYKENKEAFFPFINKYGQYKHSTWEGKITDDSQFAEAIEQEAEDLAAHPGPAEWNRFGGFENGPKYEATGHFRTKKINDRWWIIDPDGCLFWSTGVNSAGKLVVATPLNDRDHFFEGIPGKNSGNEILYSGSSYKHGLANLYRKYGENSEAEYVAVTLKRMKSWGLNTLGGWSDETIGQYPDNIKLPYTVYINAVYPGINDKFPDVFDPRWTTNVENSIKEKAAFVKNDPYFFGFFINNEIHWGNPLSLAKNTLEKDGVSVGKQVYVDLLQQRLTSIDSFNEIIGASVGSWDELLNSVLNTQGLDIYALKDINVEHYNNMCEVYFKTTRELIDKHAPGKMYLGSRWHGNHKNIYNMTVAAKYLDIFSFNAYENEVEFYPYPPESIDMPFIISEFNFGALDRGKFFTGLGYASDQRNRGEKYANFIQGALRNPKCVGAHWFMWANTTTAGRGNGENANCGLVSATDQIYYELISYMREINYHLYNYGTGNSSVIFDSRYHEDLTIYPNPVESQLHLDMINPVLQGEIFNLDGKTVWSGHITDGIINVADLTAGVYILKIKDERYISIKFVKRS